MGTNWKLEIDNLWKREFDKEMPSIELREIIR